MDLKRALSKKVPRNPKNAELLKNLEENKKNG